MSRKPKLNAELLTPEELQMGMGMGFVSAADRLGLIYLANVTAIVMLLSRHVELVMQLVADQKSGLYTDSQICKAIDELVDRLAAILRGENPRYLATDWFTDSRQLPKRLLQECQEVYSDDQESLARLISDPVREYARNLLWFVAEPDFLESVEECFEGIQGFIFLHVRGLLDIPASVPLPMVEIQLEARTCISVTPQR